ncbi:phage minor head protein [Psychrobacillus sp. BM2]|uniref:phage head morphogenesis protein n=1 Tax=Psychrobacillus sp. BM2 TaxID=3400421 RepID=UPI003B01EC81
MNKNQYVKYQKLIKTIQSKKERDIAQEYLNTLKAMKLDVSDMFEQYGENGLVKRETIQQYGRLTQLENKLMEHIKSLTKTQIQHTQEAITEVFKESYYSRGHSIELLAGMSIYNKIHPSLLEEVINNNMDTIKWSERATDNNTLLVRQLRETVMSGLVLGWGYDAMARELTKRMDIGKNKAVTIVQTETHRSLQEANLKSMERAREKGVVMKKRWLSTLDSRTRNSHRNLDGQTIEVDEYFVSRNGNEALAPGKFGVASEDIKCRCDMIAIFDGFEPTVRRARNEAGEGEIIVYKNYDEWKENLT